MCVRLLGADERKTRPVLFDFIGNAGTFTPASLLTLPEAQRQWAALPRPNRNKLPINTLSRTAV
jgi:hypothetical protein